jgi:Ras-related GTP-binding protein A/B
MARKKVLLMGKAHSGKTSMRSIIFANYLARDTMRLSPTLDVEHHHVRFLGDLVLNLWDCGGQDAFYESYFERDRETIFRSVELLIYVFDVASDCPEKDFDHFAGVLEAIEENSPDARVFVLVHKMDLVAKEEQEMIFDDRRRLIKECCDECNVPNFQCFGTSIWDETLYKAWSEIVTNLIPNISVLQSHLDDFCRSCDADEVVLFEKATFLVISHSQTSSDSNYTPSSTAQKSISNGGDQSRSDDTKAMDSSTIEEDDESKRKHKDSDADNVADSYYESTPDTENSSPTGNEGIDRDVTAPPSSSSVYSEGGADKEVELNTSTVGGGNIGEASGNNQKESVTVGQFDTHRFEKISNIVKQFKLSCEKAQSQFQGMEVSNSRFSAYIDAFTANTYIMVVSKPTVSSAATLMNIKHARSHFERFIPRS